MRTLTVRERDVARLIANSFSNKKIGEKLGIAEKTVKVHRSSIYRKLKVRTPLELFKIFERYL
ncbi:MAG: LuxR C-terminal-related transcriptional regulator [Parasutterella sp.]|uniref:LuxR C-terminal-related transcriptional regulator n=1 Tax=Parasutterella sp. TaxID=2049037 RepID=UPI003522E48F